jgi:hypothetical protein
MTLGRPIQPLQLSQEERETLALGAASDFCPGFVLAGAGHPELRGRENEHQGGAADAIVQADGGKVAQPLCGAASFQAIRRVRVPKLFARRRL